MVIEIDKIEDLKKLLFEGCKRAPVGLWVELNQLLEACNAQLFTTDELHKCATITEIGTITVVKDGQKYSAGRMVRVVLSQWEKENKIFSTGIKTPSMRPSSHGTKIMVYGIVEP